MQKKNHKRATQGKTEKQESDSEGLTQPSTSDSAGGPDKRFDPDQAFKKLKRKIDNS